MASYNQPIGGPFDSSGVCANCHAHPCLCKYFEAQEHTPLHLERRSDPVRSPTHYNLHGIECIDAIEASMSRDEFLGYLKGNVMKYLWRYRYKGAADQDLAKAQRYLEWLAKAWSKA